MEHEEHSFIAGGSANLYNHYEDQYGGPSEKWKSIYLKTYYAAIANIPIGWSILL